MGRVSVKFVLAKRTPDGALTTGIERRAIATPDHISIKADSTGGLDAWDVTKYVNVWAGTFSGADDGLLGIATFPFTTDQGPTRSGNRHFHITSIQAPRPADIILNMMKALHFHMRWAIIFISSILLEIRRFVIMLISGYRMDGLFLQAPARKAMILPKKKPGRAMPILAIPVKTILTVVPALPFGMMYGSFMNYFDDRALFMFSDGSRKRVEGLY